MSYEISIERGKIREFARAALSRNVAYDGADPVIPPTFLTTGQFFWRSEEDAAAVDVDFDMARVLHGEEEFEFFGPLPRAGQTLSATGHIGDRWEKEGTRGGQMRFAQLVTTYRDESGSIIAEQRTTVVETAQRPAAAT